MTPTVAWDLVAGRLETLGLPLSLLRKTCLTADEIGDVIAALPAELPVRVLEVGSFVGMSACTLSLCLPFGSEVVSVDPDFPLGKQIKRGTSDQLSCLEMAERLRDSLSLAGSITFERGFFSCGPTSELKQRLTTSLIDYAGIAVLSEVSKAWGRFNLVLIDGEHSAEAVLSDLRLAATMLCQPALVVTHDVTGRWGSQVRLGIEKFLSEHRGYSVEFVHNLGLLTCDDPPDRFSTT